MTLGDYTEEEVCPSCGAFAVLHEDTGFCAKCSPPTSLAYHKRERWYARYADQLESLLYMGYSLNKAHELITRDNSPRCSSCGALVKGGRPQHTIFCAKKKECRSARRRYRTLVARNQRTRVIYPKQTALIQVMLEIRRAA